MNVGLLTEAEQDELLTLSTEVELEESREQARRSHLVFMQWCWRKGEDDPFVVGLHTRRICERIDRAVEDFRRGKSSFIRIAVHNRAGKSDIVSRFLPAHFVGEFPYCEVIQTSYNVEKSLSLARDGQGVFVSSQYANLYPRVTLSKRATAVKEWMISLDGGETGGKVYSSSLHAGLTGSGFHLGIVDDYVSGREEAESAAGRDRMWNAFKDDFMTRRAPVSITIILATWWHWDDIHSRIQKANDPEGEEYVPDFPKFEFMSFPAKREKAPAGLAEQYPGDFLFLERFTPEWYREQYATMGAYSSAAILDCNPIRRTGGILDVSKVVTHPTLDEFPKTLKWYRVWDFAHSAKQRAGDNPDYTGGTLLAFRSVGYNEELKYRLYEVWVRDYVQFREEAPKRDQRIVEITRADGQDVAVLVEDSLDSTDGAMYLRERLRGIRIVKLVSCPGDKMVRCTPVEPIFEGGRVHVVRAAWNGVWTDAMERFDGSGKSHDEPVDNLTCAYQYLNGMTGYSRLGVTYK